MQALDQCGKRLDLGLGAFSCVACLFQDRLGTRNRAAAGHEQMGVLGQDDVLFVQAERDVKTLAQLGQVLQRAAQESHMAANGSAACQTGNGLRDDGLENGRSDVVPVGAFVQQRLNVGFRKHAAARCDGVNGGVFLGHFVQAAGIGVQKGGHLIDERACTAGTLTVHALFDGLIEINDLRVLAAKFDGNVGFRNEGLNRGFRRDDFLNEFDAKPLGQQQAARARNGNGHRSIAEFLGGLFKNLGDRGAHVGVVTLVNGIQNRVVLIQDRKFDRGRTDVDADSQRSGLVVRHIVSSRTHSKQTDGSKPKRERPMRLRVYATLYFTGISQCYRAVCHL